ncbi:MAG TPA: hypothetical protein VF629_15900 [Hymenobacter sp.]|jgi:hypothetical protein|uniref:hypothetical protein n=1 Tax=Hymenobacter sp. TaxID=1898978 RepID=UPI002EDA94E4
MTLREYQVLSSESQELAIFVIGTYLATRWEGDAVHLYHLPGGVFVEVHGSRHSDHANAIVAFTDSAYLDLYVPFIQLPRSLNEGQGP